VAASIQPKTLAKTNFCQSMSRIGLFASSPLIVRRLRGEQHRARRGGLVEDPLIVSARLVEIVEKAPGGEASMKAR
jgi:hypothetical protein